MALVRFALVTMLAMAAVGCSSTADTAGTGDPSAAITTTTIATTIQPETPTDPPSSTELACTQEEHIEDNGIDPPRCVRHDAAATSTSTGASVDPDEQVATVGANLLDDQVTLGNFITTTSSFEPRLSRMDFLNPDVDGSTALVIEVTSIATTDTEHDEVAWGVYFNFAQLWSQGGGFRNDTGSVKPGLVVVVDGIRYAAPMERMVLMYDFAISREEFLAASRQPG